MKVNFDSVSFGCKNVCYHNSTHNIKEVFDDDGRKLLRRIKYDKQCRDVDCVEFNSDKKVISHLHKEYTPDGCIETYKSRTQEYIRVIKTFVKDSYTHYVEKFTSKTSPEKSYVNEFIRDIKGNLVKIINNGKIINLK